MEQESQSIYMTRNHMSLMISIDQRKRWDFISNFLVFVYFVINFSIYTSNKTSACSNDLKLQLLCCDLLVCSTAESSIVSNGNRCDLFKGT